MQAAATQLEAKKTEQQRALPIIRKVRELDLKIAEKNAPIKAVNDSIEDISTSLEMLGKKQNRDCAELELKRNSLEDLLQQLEASKADEDLVEHLTGIQSRFEALQNLHTLLLSKLDEIKQADTQLKEASLVRQKQSVNLDKRKTWIWRAFKPRWLKNRRSFRKFSRTESWRTGVKANRY